MGDSLVAAASADLKNGHLDTVGVAVLAGLGASPCDFLAGGSADGGAMSFSTSLASTRPNAVVLAFSGNPGVSAHPCISHPLEGYSLQDLLVSYRRAVMGMGEMASNRGVRVYLSATPARNPSVPEGWVNGVQYGFNGDPGINQMLQTLAREKGWVYDTGASEAVSRSGPGLDPVPAMPAPGRAGLY